MKEIDDQSIKSFLETAPLYSWYEYKKPFINIGGLWINEIEAFCPKCKKLKPFHNIRVSGGGAGRSSVKEISSGTGEFKFKCVSCNKRTIEYLVERTVSENTIKLRKYGQLPPVRLNNDKALLKFFSNDLDNYEKAEKCLAHGFGIGAFAYLRRILEDNIAKLLDLIEKDADKYGNNESVLQALNDLRKESPMSDKIKIANNALPDYLKPNGANPLGKLYGSLSDGVHSLDDNDCLQRSIAIKGCLIYLVSELSARNKNEQKFNDMIGKI